MKVYSHLAAGAVAAKEDIQIQTSLRYLFVQVSGAATTITEAELKTAMVSWTKAGITGNIPIQNKVSLYTLAELNAAKEGLFLNNNTTDFACMIEIGDGGAIRNDKNSYLSLNFEGFQTDWNVTINTVDDMNVVNRVTQYIEDKINNKPQADLDLRGVKSLFMPVASVSKLYLTYNTVENGVNSARTLQLLADELKGLMFLSNEIVSANSLTAANSLIIVSEEFYGVDVNSAVAGTIEYNANQTTSIWYVKTREY